MPIEQNVVSIKEAAMLLGISRQRVQELIRSGKLPASQLAGSSVWLIRTADVLKRLQGSKKEVK
jgi:excisionase family DNA binding protein